MKRYFLFLATLGAFAHGQTVVFKAPHVSDFEYTSYLKASDQRLSPVQNYLRHHPTQAMRQMLLQRFASAQENFLSGSLEAARSGFESVVQMATQEDWTAAEREAFLFSYLRLAQINGDQNARDGFLKSALAIADEINPDESLFPPPLIARFRELKDNTELQEISLLRWTNFDLVVLNGKRIDPKNTASIKLAPGKYRATFLSSSLEPISKVADVAELEMPPPTQSSVQGSCSQHHLLTPVKNSMAFFGGQCETVSSPAKNVERLSLLPSKPNDQLIFPPEIPTGKPIYKRPWFWVATGAVIATAVLVSQKENKKSDSKPTSTRGF